jgi:TetR/AcrR family transcriptional repressor of bet genes
MVRKMPKPKGREAIKAWNRMKILEATVDTIAKYGIAGTTIGRVVELAEVSRGLVNVHFKSKKMLLLESAKHMALRYEKTRKEALKRSGDTPSEKLEAMIRTDFSPKALNSRSVGFWFAFRSQVRSMPECLPLADTRDMLLKQDITGPVTLINEEGNYNLQPEIIVDGLMAMLEGMWTDFYIHPKNFDREKAIKTSLLFLSFLFPGHFEKNVTSAADPTLDILSR